MSNTGTEATGEVPTQGAPPVYVTRPKKVVQFTYPMLGIVIAIVLLIGLTGGLLGQVLLPPRNGHRGAIGKTGVAGPVGPVGPAGSAANVDWASQGLCFDSGTSTYSFNDGTTPPLLTNAYAYLSTPVVTNGAKSCPSGSFVPLEAAPTPGT